MRINSEKKTGENRLSEKTNDFQDIVEGKKEDASTAQEQFEAYEKLIDDLRNSITYQIKVISGPKVTVPCDQAITPSAYGHFGPASFCGPFIFIPYDHLFSKLYSLIFFGPIGLIHLTVHFDRPLLGRAEGNFERQGRTERNR